MGEQDTKKARAIVTRKVLKEDGWSIEEIDVRQPGEGELLVEMLGSGVCHTDVMFGSMPEGSSPFAIYPRILGHEGSGYVKAVGPGVTVAKVGDPVLLSFDYCNSCTLCQAKHHSHCNDFNNLNFTGGPAFTTTGNTSEPEIAGRFFGQSSFASVSVVKQTSVVNAKDLVKSKEELALFSPLGCGIQTGCGSTIIAAQANAADTVCVLGLGGVGLSALMGAKVVNARRIIGVDRVESRLRLAKQLGATDVINTSDLGGKDLADVVREVAEGEGPTVTIETTGVPALLEAAITASRNYSKVVQVGSMPPDYELKINVFSYMLRGVQFIGAIEGQAYPPDFIPKMIQWYREGKFPVDQLVKTFPAEQFSQALHEMHDGTTIKPVLLW